MEYTNEFSFADPYLSGDEFVLWKGKPVKGKIFQPQDVIMIPFSIVWCGFIIFWVTMALSSGVWFMALFGIPFVLVGIYLLVGRFFHEFYLRKRTAYVITNKKIIRRIGSKVDMLDGRRMPAMYVKADINGSGSIRFGEPVVYYHRGRTRTGDPWGRTSGCFILQDVPNIMQVQQMIEMMEKE